MIVTDSPDFWAMLAQHDVLDRHGPAPEELVRYVGMVNTALNVDAVPVAAAAPADFLRQGKWGCSGPRPGVSMMSALSHSSSSWSHDVTAPVSPAMMRKRAKPVQPAQGRFCD